MKDDTNQRNKEPDAKFQCKVCGSIATGLEAFGKNILFNHRVHGRERAVPRRRGARRRHGRASIQFRDVDGGRGGDIILLLIWWSFDWGHCPLI